jgi:hypothetical protein
MKTKIDKYDRAIAWLRKYPEKITDAWVNPDSRTSPRIREAHCLFQYATPNGKPEYEGKDCGCLTEVRGQMKDAATKRLTTQIRNDSRLPSGSWGITPENLEIFAEWQRRLDKELGRKP